MKWSFEGYEELYESDLMVINGGDSTGSSSGGGATTPVAPTSGSSSGGGATTTPPASPPTSSTPGSTSGGGSSTPYSAPTGSSSDAGATTPYMGPTGSTTGGGSTSTGSTSAGGSSTPYTPGANGTGGTYAPAVLASDDALRTAILANSDQKYTSGINDCDIWVKKNLDAIGAHVNGLTDPSGKNCKTEKADLLLANSNALTSESALKIGQTYVGCNEGHMFFVTRTSGGQYQVADMTSDTGISGYRPDGVFSQANFDSYFGNNNNGAVYVPIYKN